MITLNLVHAVGENRDKVGLTLPAPPDRSRTHRSGRSTGALALVRAVGVLAGGTTGRLASSWRVGYAPHRDLPR